VTTNTTNPWIKSINIKETYKVRVAKGKELLVLVTKKMENIYSTVGTKRTKQNSRVLCLSPRTSTKDKKKERKELLIAEETNQRELDFKRKELGCKRNKKKKEQKLAKKEKE
jgi:hypothetical protein